MNNIGEFNKSDLPGAGKVVTEVQIMLEQQYAQSDWMPPVVPVSCLNGQGISALVAKIQKHRAYLLEKGKLSARRSERIRAETLDIVTHKWRQLMFSQLKLPGRVNELLDKAAAREMDPYTAANAILAHINRGKQG